MTHHHYHHYFANRASDVCLIHKMVALGLIGTKTLVASHAKCKAAVTVPFCLTVCVGVSTKEHGSTSVI